MSDNDLYVFTIPVMRGIRASPTKSGVENRILAERKPYVEMWIPEVGVLFVVMDKVYKCVCKDDFPMFGAITGIDLVTGEERWIPHLSNKNLRKPEGI